MLIAPSFYNTADQNIYNQGFSFVPQEKFRGGAFSFPTSSTNGTTGITTLPTAMSGGGGGGGNNYTGGVNDLINNYNQTTKDRYFRTQETPLVDGLYQTKVGQTFMGMPSYREQQLTGPDLGEYIGNNLDVPLEQTLAGKIQSGLGKVKEKASGILSNMKGIGPISMVLGSMDKFDSLSAVDREFINQNMGYTGPTVFGPNNSGLSKDPYGINTRSAFGNYASYVSDMAAGYADLSEEDYNNLSTFQKQKVDFYRAKQKELQEIKDAEIAKQKKQAEDFMKNNPNYGNNYRSDRDHSGDGGYGNTSGDSYGNKGGTRSAHNRSSDLGFSDIRLKENVELIGKSPSNINIYRFNYLNNPTKYQGVMAHEVPWASQKHNSGYLMVDYNKVDVDFKKDIDYNNKTLYKENLG